MKTKTILHGFIDNQGTWLWEKNILFLKYQIITLKMKARTN